MGLFGLLLLVVIVLAIIGLGWTTFSSGVITGFDKAIDIGTPIVKNLTQETKEFVISPEQLGLNWRVALLNSSHWRRIKH